MTFEELVDWYLADGFSLNEAQTRAREQLTEPEHPCYTEDEMRRAYVLMPPACLQQVLAKLGKLFGHPYRPYTPDEWAAALMEVI